MKFMEFLEMLVNAETEDERMNLVKEHAETFNQEGGEELQTSIDELQKQLEESNSKITELKQEIKDRFFGKYKEEKEDSKDNMDEGPQENEEKEEKETTLKDLGFGEKITK